MDFFNPVVFATGMVALVNPCGFALLPAYLGMFLGQKDESPSRITSLNRAQGVGLAMTLGILVVFLGVGVAFGGIQSWFAEYLPYFNIALGIGLIALGIAMLFGFELKFNVPKLNKGGKTGSFSSMFLFGVSYAIASLSCTLPLFLGAVGLSASQSTGFFESLGGFVSYGLGMGLLAIILTLLMAVGKRELVNKFRALLPVINKISAVVLLIVGPYVILYGIWEIEVFDDPRNITPWIDSIIGWGIDFQSSMSNWFQAKPDFLGGSISRAGALGIPFVIVNLGLIVAGFVVRRRGANSVVEEVAESADMDLAEA